MYLSQFTAINLPQSNFDNLGFSLSICYVYATIEDQVPQKEM